MRRARPPTASCCSESRACCSSTRVRGSVGSAARAVVHLSSQQHEDSYRCMPFPTPENHWHNLGSSEGAARESPRQPATARLRDPALLRVSVTPGPQSLVAIACLATIRIARPEFLICLSLANCASIDNYRPPGVVTVRWRRPSAPLLGRGSRTPPRRRDPPWRPTPRRPAR